jgi:predicted amidohydrolase
MNRRALNLRCSQTTASRELLHTTLLLSDKGTITDSYRKAHLDAGEKRWAAAGDDLPVFETPLGRIGLMLGSDVCFPEVSGVCAVRRADILPIPSGWEGVPDPRGGARGSAMTG